LGEWYEILRIPNVYEEGYSCMMDNFTISPDGATKVHSHAYNARLVPGKHTSNLTSYIKLILS
jgi:lipocalin